MSGPVTEATPPVIDEAGLRLVPAMECRLPPDWPGARWVGSLDVRCLREHTRLILAGSDGYERAKILIRDGSVVRGFVDVDAPGGVIERGVLETAVGQLPRATTAPAAVSSPSITVILCTRDRDPLLRTALNGILRLDYPNFDVVIVDNAARTPATRDMVRDEFQDPRVRLIDEPIPGLAQARNTGLRHARGDIVAFTDDDTVVDKAWLREIAAGFERAPDAVCVSGLVASGELRSRTQAYFDARVSWSGNLEPMAFSMAEPPADMPMFPFTVGAFGTGANFALDRRTALSLGGFDTAFGAGTRTGGGEDIDMFTRVLLAGHSLVVQPCAIVWHRHRDDFAELRSQAHAYGNGLGAWITKILMNPRTARMALARSPHAVRRLLSMGKHGQRQAAQPGQRLDAVDREIAALGRFELLSVAVGPLNYFRQRAAGEGVIK
jgi:GT2 family glycosyltransferase